MRRMRDKLKKVFGSAMIEMALLLPLLMLILVGIIEFSIIFYDKSIITSASREGARYGIILRQPTYASSASIITYTTNYCANKLVTFSSTPTPVTVTATSSPSAAFGGTLTVTVNYTYTSLVLYKLALLNQQFNMSATTVMQYE